MKNNFRILCSIFCAISFHFATAQVRFIGNLSFTQNLEGVYNISAISAYSIPVSGIIEVLVTEERSSQAIVRLEFRNVNTLPGVNTLGKFRGNMYRVFFDNQFSKIFKNSSSLPPGSYSVCCQFIPDDKILDVSNLQHCLSTTVLPMYPLQLINPSDKICNYRPSFIWHGKKVTSPGVFYKIVCVGIKDDQSAEDALQNNIPVVDEITQNQITQISYPVGNKSLEETKKYAWQVFEIAGKEIINVSDIFEFIVECKEKVEVLKKNFAEAKSFYTGTRYYFTQELLLSFNNPYATGPLDYTITEVATGFPLENLPAVQMSRGLNNMAIPNKNISGLQQGTEYCFRLLNIGSVPYYFNFIIKEGHE